MIKNSLILLILLSGVVLSKTFEISIIDMVVNEDDNTFTYGPGTFESPELKAASLAWLDYLDRVVYSPKPIKLGLDDIAFTTETLGSGGPTLLAPGDAFEAALGLEIDYTYPQSLLVALGAEMDESRGYDQSINIDSKTNWDLTIDRHNPSILFGVLAHELVHGLGFTSGLQTDGSWGGELNQPSIFDSFIYSGGKRLVTMQSNAERKAVFYNEGNVVFSGPITNRYAAEILTAGGGADGVQLQASTTYEDITLSHFAHATEPELLMKSGSRDGQKEDLFVSFAVLADLGYGDMLDTQVTTHAQEAGTVVFAVRSETLQERASIDNVVLRIPVTEGLMVSSAQTGVNCVPVEGAVDCTLDAFNANVDQLVRIDFEGTDGGYPLLVDVEHRAFHVDADPLNNFLEITAEVGTNPLTGILLGAKTIDEGVASGTLIGNLSVSASEPIEGEVLYRLVKGEGDNDNGKVQVVEGQIISSATLDHEVASQLSIRVRASLANGFSYEDQFNLAVNDTKADGCFNHQVVMEDDFLPRSIPFVTSAYASTGGMVSNSVVTVLLWLFNMVALGFVRQSRRLGRRWKQALVVILALGLLSCGGGDSSPSASRSAIKSAGAVPSC